MEEGWGDSELEDGPSQVRKQNRTFTLHTYCTSDMGSQQLNTTQSYFHTQSSPFILAAHYPCRTCNSCTQTWSIHPTHAIFLRFQCSSAVLSHSSEVSSDAMANLYRPEFKMVRHTERQVVHHVEHFSLRAVLPLLLAMHLVCGQWGTSETNNSSCHTQLSYA